MRDEPDDGVVGDPGVRGPEEPEGDRPADRTGEPGTATAAGDVAEPPVRRPYWGDDAPAAPDPELSAVRSPRPRLRAARTAVWVASVLALVDAGVSAWGWDETRRAIGTEARGAATPVDGLRGEDTAVDALNAAIDAGVVSLVVSGLALLVAAVFVVRWQNVAVRNQRPLGVHPRYSVQAAGWSWFVPFWCFFGPKRVFNDLWRAAEPEGESAVGRDHWIHRDVPRLFQLWWAVWLLSFLVELIGPFADTALDLGQQRRAFLTEGLGSLAIFVAGGLFVVVLERITERHDARIAERAAEA